MRTLFRSRTVNCRSILVLSLLIAPALRSPRLRLDAAHQFADRLRRLCPVTSHGASDAPPAAPRSQKTDRFRTGAGAYWRVATNTWGPEIAEAYDKTYAAQSEPSVLNPSSTAA